MTIRVDWNANPINVWYHDRSVLDELIEFLNANGIRKHSIVMPDHHRGGFIFFVYEKLEQNLIALWEGERGG